MRLLVVEDDAALAEALEFSLRKDGHAVDRVADGDVADRTLRLFDFDLVVLDLNLPVLDGLEVLRRLRQRRRDTPVLIVSARDAGDECVRVLDSGADDYLVKPFSVNVFGARVRALLRRRASVRPPVLSYARLTFDTASRTAMVSEMVLDLSAREVSLLEALLQSFGQIVGKERLLSQLYGNYGDVGINTIEVCVHRLRKKLYGSGVELRTAFGRGYLLCDDKLPAGGSTH